MKFNREILTMLYVFFGCVVTGGLIGLANEIFTAGYSSGLGAAIGAFYGIVGGVVSLAVGAITGVIVRKTKYGFRITLLAYVIPAILTIMYIGSLFFIARQ